MTRTRRSFTDELKRKAVKLCKQPGARVCTLRETSALMPVFSRVG